MMKLDKQMIIAHRGASGLVEHENTIEAFEKAVEVELIQLNVMLENKRRKNNCCPR